MTMNKTFHTKIYAVVPNELLKEVQKLSKLISMSALIRIALSEYLEKRKNTEPIELFEKQGICYGGKVYANVSNEMLKEIKQLNEYMSTSVLLRFALSEYLGTGINNFIVKNNEVLKQ